MTDQVDRGPERRNRKRRIGDKVQHGAVVGGASSVGVILLYFMPQLIANQQTLIDLTQTLTVAAMQSDSADNGEGGISCSAICTPACEAQEQ